MSTQQDNAWDHIRITAKAQVVIQQLDLSVHAQILADLHAIFNELKKQEYKPSRKFFTFWRREPLVILFDSYGNDESKAPEYTIVCTFDGEILRANEILAKEKFEYYQGLAEEESLG